MTDVRKRVDLLYAPVAEPAAGDVNPTHTCLICGRPAGFGFDVFLRQNKPGRWSCFDHREKVERMGP